MASCAKKVKTRNPGVDLFCLALSKQGRLEATTPKSARQLLLAKLAFGRLVLVEVGDLAKLAMFGDLCY